MFAGQGLRVLLQAVQFVVIARLLDAEGYGAFVGVTALVAIAAPFAGWGGGDVLIENVARDRRSFALYWGSALLWVVCSGLVLTFVMVGVGTTFLTKIPLLLWVAVSVSDLIFSRLLAVSAQAFQSVERLHRTAQIFVLPNILRLAAVGFLIFHPAPSVVLWGMLYLASNAVTAVLGVWLACFEIERPAFQWKRAYHQVRGGGYFAVGLSAQTVYNDIDKTMLARMSTLDATGIYGAAYRIVEVAFTPVRSLLYAAYARFFREGAAGGLRGSWRFALRLVPLAGAYAAAVGVALFFAAPLLPVVLGPNFGEAVSALRWLCLLPLLKSFHYLAADALTGSGHQPERTAVQIAVAGLNVALNLWLIPLYSWRGAAWASLASDGTLLMALWATVLIRARSSATLRSA